MNGLGIASHVASYNVAICPLVLPLFGSATEQFYMLRQKEAYKDWLLTQRSCKRSQ